MNNRNYENEKLDQLLELAIEASSEAKEAQDKKHRNGGFRQYFSHLKENIKKAEQTTVVKAKGAAKAIDGHVHKKPWIYIASAVISGLAIGFFFSSRRRG